MKLFKRAFLAAAFGISALMFASGANAVSISYNLNDGLISGTADTIAGQTYTSAVINTGGILFETNDFAAGEVWIEFTGGHLLLEELSGGQSGVDEELAFLTLNFSYVGCCEEGSSVSEWTVDLSLSHVFNSTAGDTDFGAAFQCAEDPVECGIGSGTPSITLIGGLGGDFNENDDLTDGFIIFKDLHLDLTAQGGLGGDRWSLDSIQFAFNGNSVSIPEPATLALFGIGLAGFGVLARRRRRQDSAA